MLQPPPPQADQVRSAIHRRSDRELLAFLLATVLVALPLWFLFRQIPATRERAWVYAPFAAAAMVSLTKKARALWVGFRQWQAIRR